MILLELFWRFFIIGLLSFGGGYSAIPLIEQQIVIEKGWLTFEQYIDIITISEMTPGPIGINCATFTGIQIAGIWGGITATLGNIMPSAIIVLTLAYFFNKYKSLNAVQGVLSGLRPCIVGLIASVGITIFMLLLPPDFSQINNINIVALCIFFAGVFLLRKFKKISPVMIILGSGVVGIAAYYLNII